MAPDAAQGRRADAQRRGGGTIPRERRMDARRGPLRVPPEPAASAQPLGAPEPQSPKALLRKDHLLAKLFVPLAVAVLGLTAYNVMSTWRMETRQLRHEIVTDVDNTERLMRQMLDDDALRLRSALGTFMHNQEFKELFRARDRHALLDRGIPLFRHLSDKYRLTRFYFIEPDGTAFARLHRPGDYGQKVTHATVRKAIATGQAAWGLEVGKVAFALRLVEPYHDGDELLGYIEFAEDIDHILATLTGTGGAQIVVAIDKDFLSQAKWAEASANRQAGLGSWDDFDNVVVSSSTLSTVPAELRPLIARELDDGSRPGTLIRIGDTAYGAGHVPMVDVLGRTVGHALVLHDMTSRLAALRQTTRTQALVGVGIACVLILVACGTLRHTMETLAASRASLKDHAAHLSDALTRERRVSDMLAAVLNEPSLDTPLQLLADSARESCAADIGLIALLDTDTSEITNLTLSNCTPEEIPPDFKPEQSPPFATLLRTDGVVSLDDVMAHPDVRRHPERHLKLHTMLGTALRDDSGTLGVFAVGHSKAHRPFADEHKKILATMADLAAVAVNRAGTIDQLKRAVHEAEEATLQARAAREAAEHHAAESAAAYEALLATKQRLAIHIAISEAANRPTSLIEALASITDACLTELDFDSSATYLLDEETGHLVMSGHQHLSEPFLAHMRRCPVKPPDRRDSLESNVLFFNREDLNERFANEPKFLAEGLTSAASVPLAVADRFVGLIFFCSHVRAEIPPRARALIAEIARSIQPAIANTLQAGEPENRITGMQHEINTLLAELGRPPRYTIPDERLTKTHNAASGPR
jgi:GAF domain-containing protein